MTRRIKRAKEFEITLSIHDDSFIRTPRDSQRNWVLNRALKEFNDELIHLDSEATTFVPGSDFNCEDRAQSELDDEEIMEDWQIPIMRAMAKAVCASHGDVLEIGFGRGIASDFIQQEGVRTHTIVECNASIVQRFESWQSKHDDKEIQVVNGMWQDVIGKLGQFDGIFFHTYPLNEAEFVEQVVQSSTFAEHFFDAAACHLNPGGCFSYLTNETNSLSRAHQRAILRRFRSFSMSVVDNLNIPHDTRDAMWGNSMIVVQVVK